MGGCVSATAARAAKEHSDQIDRQLEEDGKEFKRECKILIMGPSESGKSTILKQMKIIHHNGFSNQELAAFRPAIYSNVIDSVQSVLTYIKKIGLECVDSNRALAEKVLDFRLQDTTSNGQPYLPTEIVEAISQLSKDPIFIKYMDDQYNYLIDNASYFIDEVLRIGSPNYLPNEADVLRARQENVEITEMRFTLGQLSIHMLELGRQKSERRKWIHCFETITSLLLCIALPDYDRNMLNDYSVLLPGPRLPTTALFLPIYRRLKLPKAPLEGYCPEYTGGLDVDKAAKHILSQFMKLNWRRLAIYPHFTQATDTKQMVHFQSTTLEHVVAKHAKNDFV